MQSNPATSQLGSARSAVAAASLALLACCAAGGAKADALRWVRDAGSRSSGVAAAVATAPRSDALAFADEVGVWIRNRGASPRRVLRAEGIEDLAYAADGGLWVAASDGLWWIAPSGLAAAGVGTGGQDRSPAPGATARQVHRIAVEGRWLAVATEAGAFASLGGERWRRIDGAAPAGAAASVALACDGDGRCDVWWIAGSAVWRAELRASRERRGFRIEGVRQAAIPGAPAGVAPLDLTAGIPGYRVLVVYPRALAGLAEGPRSVFDVWRPALPPGAEARRVAAGLGRYWLASNRGLLVADDVRAAWRRAGVPAGWVASSAIASNGAQLFVATATGIVRASRIARSREGGEPVALARARGGERPPSPPSPPSPDGQQAEPHAGDSLERLHRLALAHLSLDPSRQREWRRRADRRSFWPEVDLEVGYGGSLDRAFDEDQAFVSGATRQLYDRDRGRGDDWDASLRFTWDLPAAMFDSEVIDVAREERLWLSLRDDVLDEINQLYFERRRVLLELSALVDLESIEAARLRLRADELAAGLDAWTGGAFTASDAAFDHSRSRRDPLRWQPRPASPSPPGSGTE